MNRTTFIVLACLIGSVLYGQQLTWMPEEGELQEEFTSISFGIDYRAFVLWNDSLILAQKKNDLIVIDTETLKVRNVIEAKSFLRNKFGELVGFVQTATQWGLVLITTKNQNATFVFVPIENGVFGEPLELMAYPKKEIDQVCKKIVTSENGELVLFQVKTTEHIELRVFNDSFQEIYKTSIPRGFKEFGKNLAVLGFNPVLDNNGNIYLAGLLDDLQERSSSWDGIFPFFLSYNRSKDQLDHQVVKVYENEISKEEHVWANKNSIYLNPHSIQFIGGTKYGEMELIGTSDIVKFVYNTTTNEHLIVGLMESESGGGIFTVKYNHTSGNLEPIKKYEIPSEIKSEIIEKRFKGKKAGGSLVLHEVFIRENGGITVLCEIDDSGVSTFTTVDNSIPNYSRTETDRYPRQICYEIIYLGINDDGHLSFSGLINKDQRAGTSRRGSFAATCNNGKIDLFYNSLPPLNVDDGKNRFMHCTIGSDGSLQTQELSQVDNMHQIIPNKAGYYREGIATVSLGTPIPVITDNRALLMFAIKNRKSVILKIE